MKITCKQLGETKLLTIGNEYEVINESDNRYTIINDKGIQKNYGKNLFNIVEEIPEVPAKIEINELNINTSTSSEHDEDQNETYISSKIKISGNNNFKFDFTIDRLAIMDSEISCGVSQLDGINNMMNDFKRFKSQFTDYIENNNFEFNVEINFDDTINEIKKGMFQDIFAEIEDTPQKSGMLLISTNINNNDSLDQETIDILDEVAVSVNEFYNPNSGNTCKIWNINLNE